MSTKAPPAAETYDEWLRRPDVDAVAAMCRFFMGDDPVHQTLRNIAAKLDEHGIGYAIAGGMALGRIGSCGPLWTWTSWSRPKVWRPCIGNWRAWAMYRLSPAAST